MPNHNVLVQRIPEFTADDTANDHQLDAVDANILYAAPNVAENIEVRCILLYVEPELKNDFDFQYNTSKTLAKLNELSTQYPVTPIILCAKQFSHAGVKEYDRLCAEISNENGLKNSTIIFRKFEHYNAVVINTEQLLDFSNHDDQGDESSVSGFYNSNPSIISSPKLSAVQSVTDYSGDDYRTSDYEFDLQNICNTITILCEFDHKYLYENRTPSVKQKLNELTIALINYSHETNPDALVSREEYIINQLNDLDQFNKNTKWGIVEALFSQLNDMKNPTATTLLKNLLLNYSRMILQPILNSIKQELSVFGNITTDLGTFTVEQAHQRAVVASYVSQVNALENDLSQASTGFAKIEEDAIQLINKIIVKKRFYLALEAALKNYSTTIDQIGNLKYLKDNKQLADKLQLQEAAVYNEFVDKLRGENPKLSSIYNAIIDRCKILNSGVKPAVNLLTLFLRVEEDGYNNQSIGSNMSHRQKKEQFCIQNVKFLTTLSERFALLERVATAMKNVTLSQAISVYINIIKETIAELNLAQQNTGDLALTSENLLISSSIFLRKIESKNRSLDLIKTNIELDPNIMHNKNKLGEITLVNEVSVLSELVQKHGLKMCESIQAMQADKVNKASSAKINFFKKK